MTILYIVLLVSLLGAYALVLNRVKKAFEVLTPILGWMVGLAYFVLGPLTILTLNGGFTFPDAYGLAGTWWKIDLSKPQFMIPYLALWLSLILTCATVYFCCPGPAKKQEGESVISRSRLERIILTTMAFSLVDWIATIWLLGGFAQFLVSHWYTRAMPLIERFGSLYVLYMRVSLVNQIVFASAAALYTSEGLRRRDTRWSITLLILLFLFLEVLMSGNRIFLALYLMAFLASCWVYGRKKLLFTMVAASPLLILVFSVWAWVRQDLSKISDSVDTLVINADMGNRAITSLMDVTEGASVMLALNIVNDYGNKYDYLYGSTYARFFTFFQPRTLNADRTPDFQSITAANYDPGADTTLASTAFGEAYANFGFAGILVMPMFTLFAISFSNRLIRAPGKHALLTAVSFVIFIWFARGTFAGNSISLIGAAFLIRVLRLERTLGVPAAAHRAARLANSTPAFPLASANPLA